MSIQLVKIKKFFVLGSTGCSCCRSDNFVDGPYDTAESALDATAYHERNKTVASQYARNGIYEVREIEVEYLVGDERDRWIVDTRIFEGHLYDNGEDLYNNFSYEGTRLL